MEKSEKPAIGVIGVGWVGLVTAAGFAELGHPVVAVDIDDARSTRLRAREPLPIHEPGLSELVERNGERLRFETDISEVLAAARILFCCVDTPPTYSGDADLSRVEAVVATLPEGADHALVMKSTVPAGTGASIVRQRPDLAYVSCPEFLKEGSAVNDFLHPDRVVIGADAGADWAADAVAEAVRAPRRRVLPHRRRLGGDDQARLERLPGHQDLVHQRDRQRVRGGRGRRHGGRDRAWGWTPGSGPKFLNAGIGWGGSCFGKDTVALKKLAGNTGYHFQLLSAVIDVNELQKRRVVGKLKEHLGELAGRRVGLLGLAFKPDTDDMRDASSLVLAARLQGEGAEVSAYDPTAAERARALLPDVEIASSAAEALEGADAAILVTEWPEFAELDWEELAGLMSNPLLVDGRNFLDPARLRAAGFAYEGIGRGSAVGLGRVVS